MANQSEQIWARFLGAGIAILFLLMVWAACGGWLANAINGGEPRNFEQRR